MSEVGTDIDLVVNEKRIIREKMVARRRVVEAAFLGEGTPYSPVGRWDEDKEAVIGRSPVWCVEIIKHRLEEAHQRAGAVVGVLDELENSNFDDVRVAVLLKQAGGLVPEDKYVGRSFVGRVDAEGKVVVFAEAKKDGVGVEKKMGLEHRDVPDKLLALARRLNQEFFPKGSGDVGSFMAVIVEPPQRACAVYNHCLVLQDSFDHRDAIAYHELVHELALQKYGICAVPGMVEGAAVKGAQAMMPRDDLNATDSLYGAVQFGGEMAGADRRGNWLVSPTIIQMAVENEGRKADKQSLSYQNGVAIYEAVMSDCKSRGMNEEKAREVFWELYKNCCGTVKDSQGRVLYAGGRRFKDPVTGRWHSSVAILRAAMAKTPQFRGREDELFRRIHQKTMEIVERARK